MTQGTGYSPMIVLKLLTSSSSSMFFVAGIFARTTHESADRADDVSASVSKPKNGISGVSTVYPAQMVGRNQDN